MSGTGTKESAVEICHGPECREFNAAGLLSELQTQEYRVERGHCRGLCLYAPVAHIGNHCIPEASVERIVAADSCRSANHLEI